MMHKYEPSESAVFPLGAKGFLPTVPVWKSLICFSVLETSSIHGLNLHRQLQTGCSSFVGEIVFILIICFHSFYQKELQVSSKG